MTFTLFDVFMYWLIGMGMGILVTVLFSISYECITNSKEEQDD